MQLSASEHFKRVLSAGSFYSVRRMDSLATHARTQEHVSAVPVACLPDAVGHVSDPTELNMVVEFRTASGINAMETRAADIGRPDDEVFFRVSRTNPHLQKRLASTHLPQLGARDMSIFRHALIDKPSDDVAHVAASTCTPYGEFWSLPLQDFEHYEKSIVEWSCDAEVSFEPGAFGEDARLLLSELIMANAFPTASVHADCDWFFEVVDMDGNNENPNLSVLRNLLGDGLVECIRQLALRSHWRLTRLGLAAIQPMLRLHSPRFSP